MTMEKPETRWAPLEETVPVELFKAEVQA